MKLITAFGDSIMRGVVLDKIAEKPRYTLLDENFSSRCGTQLNLAIRNYGRYGNTTAHGLRELERRKEQIANSDFCVLSSVATTATIAGRRLPATPRASTSPSHPSPPLQPNTTSWWPASDASAPRL